MKTDKKEDIPWLYMGIPVTPDQVPSWACAFIYKISRLDQFGNKVKIYIGKKQLQSTTRKKIGVREKAATKTRKTFKKTTKDSDWSNYWSSCNELKEDVQKYPGMWVREILEWCYSKKNSSYKELWWQFRYNVLEKDTYNSNINGSLYKHDTDRQLYEEFLARKRKPKDNGTNNTD